MCEGRVGIVEPAGESRRIIRVRTERGASTGGMGRQIRLPELERGILAGQRGEPVERFVERVPAEVERVPAESELG